MAFKTQSHIFIVEQGAAAAAAAKSRSRVQLCATP